MIGWVTVAAYLLCAFVTLRVGMRLDSASKTHHRERLFWLLTAALMVALALNKQLDLQSLLTAIGRCSAKAEGWYEQRRGFQQAFIIWLAMAAAGIGGVCGFALRHSLRRTGLALFGLVLVGGFILIRAVGFHHVDVLLNQRISGASVNGILELSGLFLILLGGLRQLRRP